MTVKEIYSKAFDQYLAGSYNAALKTVDKMKRRAPNYKDAYYLEAAIWNKLENPFKEYYALKKLLPLLDTTSPEGRKFAAEIFYNIALSCKTLNLWKDAKDFYLMCIKTDDEKKYFSDAVTSAIFYANAVENFSAEDFRALYCKYTKSLPKIIPPPHSHYNHEKIRVGFLSGNFKVHPIINWAWALLTKLDKNFFETYCYSAGKNSDIVTEHLKKTTVWRDIHDLTDEEAAKIIHDDEIDILFDLDGHTSNNRLGVAAYRPASVQISGVGYMNSTGLHCVDYFLSDVYCAGDENFFTEKVIKLPHSHICYEPFINVDTADAPPCLKNNFVTFGSFNRFGKITDSMLIAWKKILDAVPESRLIFKNSLLQTNDGKKFVGEHLKALGFDLRRVEMRSYKGTWLVTSPDWLIEYGDIDIALDTFPYTGGVTTCEALYMGVPVISLYGDRHGSRFGLSILKNIGLDELAVSTYDEYINRAIMLAGDWELLKILRKNLRTMMKKSPLMDSQNYISEMQNVFVKILNEQKNFWRETDNGY